ncbi:hypothetical protein GGQ74_002665 [Desulfobaculum xiamenense]|uniref:Uncharacterized protein n=1 Tax=Desulfobaculum xiamenense TaxID=995050 RepID=A0A846QLJ1_9BACT|nr:hypothetical protein [Desulfobaculum xiamenense]NJB68971.1 hypothetical protein [Desulfobaculum xiamenense]
MERTIELGLNGKPSPKVVIRQRNKRIFKGGELIQLVLQALKEYPERPLSKHDIDRRIECYILRIQSLIPRLDNDPAIIASCEIRPASIAELNDYGRKCEI